MACTEKCQQQTAARQAEIEAWRAKWPNACPDCRGAGGKGYPGSFDHKAGVGEPPGWDPCDCICLGTCPRCGNELAFPEFEDDAPCVYCHWHEGDDQEPQPHECHCWYAETLAFEDESTPMSSRVIKRLFDEEP